METYDAHEYILVVGQVGHRLDILDVGMLVNKVYFQIILVCTSIYKYKLVHTSIYKYLWGLARTIVRISPQHNLADLV